MGRLLLCCLIGVSALAQTPPPDAESAKIDPLKQSITVNATIAAEAPASISAIPKAHVTGQTAGARNTPTVLYALDGATGKEFWNSGKSILGFLPRNGGISGGGTQIYLGTHDGTLYAFGFPMEH